MKNSKIEKLLETARQQDEKIRAGLKAKMLKDGPNRMTEVDATELAYIMRTDMGALIAEVEAEFKSNAQGSERGLMAMAGDLAKEPDHKAHLDRVADQREVTFEEVVKPLMKWMAENACPHQHVVVSGTSAELFGGLKSFNTFEFIKD